MKVAIGADNLGYELKEKVKKHLLEEGYDIIDLGTTDIDNPILYIEASDNVAKAIQNGEAERGIVFCGTGMGVSIIANKHKGVYCACVESQWAARESRIVNDANMIGLGGRIFGEGMAIDTVDTFLTTPFCQAPEARVKNLSGLLDQVKAFEEKQFV
ncbi:MAG: RpiB/LacA/LacB family sugar-phosphate isomerase [Lachnospiraceae bacterium]|jgi:ribose 5-phosphate isomerase B